MYGYNPYQQIYQAPMQRTEVIRVTGENGARALSMAPNSSTLVLDETAPLVWLCQTDGAGYKTVTPYNITPYQPAPAPDVQGIEERLRRLEEMLNAKPDSAANAG